MSVKKLLVFIKVFFIFSIINFNASANGRGHDHGKFPELVDWTIGTKALGQGRLRAPIFHLCFSHSLMHRRSVHLGRWFIQRCDYADIRSAWVYHDPLRVFHHHLHHCIFPWPPLRDFDCAEHCAYERRLVQDH